MCYYFNVNERFINTRWDYIFFVHITVRLFQSEGALLMISLIDVVMNVVPSW